jgi:hypothetical protein
VLHSESDSYILLSSFLYCTLVDCLVFLETKLQEQLIDCRTWQSAGYSGFLNAFSQQAKGRGVRVHISAHSIALSLCSCRITDASTSGLILYSKLSMILYIVIVASWVILLFSD